MAPGYTTPTPIQERAIPPIIAGRDLLGCAQTGTGKTAAFALPILHQLLADPLPPKKARRWIRVLILSPTRELAAQIGDNFREYAHRTKLRQAVIFGGVGQSAQTRALRGGRRHRGRHAGAFARFDESRLHRSAERRNVRLG